MNKQLYKVIQPVNKDASNERFYMHSHDSYEIFLFLSGDSEYSVEGNIYKLEPYDIMVLRKGEMHRVFHNGNIPYDRIVIMVSPEYFQEYNCGELEEEFLKKTNGAHNKIDAELCVSSGLYDAIMRLQKYSNNFKDLYTPVANAIVTEILFLINNVKLFSKDDISNVQLKSIISYINNNYTREISLDEIAAEFFISKHHLCRFFKQGTGLTVYNYITNKRIMRVKELKANGCTRSEAALLAGFGNYSSYYRAYQKIYGHAPSEKIQITQIEI